MDAPKRIVCVLKNGEVPARYYTGITSDLKSRLARITPDVAFTPPDIVRRPSMWC
jgi:hypothetical protein